MEGIKPTFITAGEMKAAGNPHEPLEGESLAYLQESVNDSYEMFVNAVADARGLDPEVIRNTEARVYKGRKAKKLGLVDDVKNFASIKKELADLSQKAGYTTILPTKGQKMENDVNVEKLSADFAEAQASLEVTKANLEKLTSAVIAEGYTITEDGISKEEAAQTEIVEYAGQTMDLLALPEAAANTIRTLIAEKAEAQLEEEAAKLFPSFSAERGKLLVKALAGFEGEEKAELEAALKGANFAMKDFTEEKGESSVDDLTDPSEKLDGLIADHMEEHGVDIHAARTAVAMSAQGRELQKAIKAMKG
jgi:hypothetical protein